MRAKPQIDPNAAGEEVKRLLAEDGSASAALKYMRTAKAARKEALKSALTVVWEAFESGATVNGYSNRKEWAANFAKVTMRHCQHIVYGRNTDEANKRPRVQDVKDGDALKQVMTAEERRLSTARHEGGHALVLLALDVPFKNVEILPKETVGAPNLGFVRDGDDLCLGLIRMDQVAWVLQGCRMEIEDQIMQALAGVAGEQIEYEQPIWSEGDWQRAKGDLQSAKELGKVARRCGMLRGSYLRNGFQEAWEILRRYRTKHAALVARLLEKSILTYSECVEIWNKEIDQ